MRQNNLLSRATWRVFSLLKAEKPNETAMNHEFSTDHTFDDCESLAPLLTALFDGEADATQAAQIRAHLLLCQRCATVWAQWNTTRRLLQSAPVVAPPPALFARIMLACRLLAPPCAGEKIAAPPADLTARILAQTVGAQPRTSRFSFALPRPVAFSALVVPAMAAFLLILQGSNGLQTPVAENTVPTSVELPQRAAQPKPAAKTFAAPLSAPSEMEKVLAIALELDNQPIPTTPAAPRLARSIEPRRTFAQPTFQTVSWPAPALERREIARKTESAPKPIIEVRSVALIAPRKTAKIAPAVLASDSAPIRLRRAAFRPSLAATSQPTHGLRASLPTAPKMPTVRLAALHSIESAGESLEDVRSLVEDYRATLAGDSEPTDFTTNS